MATKKQTEATTPAGAMPEIAPMPMRVDGNSYPDWATLLETYTKVYAKDVPLPFNIMAVYADFKAAFRDELEGMTFEDGCLKFRTYIESTFGKEVLADYGRAFFNKLLQADGIKNYIKDEQDLKVKSWNHVYASFVRKPMIRLMVEQKFKKHVQMTLSEQYAVVEPTEDYIVPKGPRIDFVIVHRNSGIHIAAFQLYPSTFFNNLMSKQKGNFKTASAGNSTFVGKGLAPLFLLLFEKNSSYSTLDMISEKKGRFEKMNADLIFGVVNRFRDKPESIKASLVKRANAIFATMKD